MDGMMNILHQRQLLMRQFHLDKLRSKRLQILAFMGLCWIGTGATSTIAVPSYADIKAKVDSWLDALTFEKDTITFEKGSFAGPEDNIVLSIVEGEDIPLPLRLREVNTIGMMMVITAYGIKELYFNGRELTVSADGEILGYPIFFCQSGGFGLPDSDGITLFTYVSATEDSQFSYQLDIDEEKTLATLEMADAPEWMSVDLSSGTLSGLPLANDVGSLLFELKGAYSDGTEFSQSISLTVKEINDAPTIDNSLPTSVSEDIEFGHQFEFSDEEDGSENLVFEITDAPDWMDFSIMVSC